jgi:hypothetical protein
MLMKLGPGISYSDDHNLTYASLISHRQLRGLAKL